MTIKPGRQEGYSMLFLGFICDEQHYGELVAYGDFPPLVPYGTTFATV